jgi:hypothetical protein
MVGSGCGVGGKTGGRVRGEGWVTARLGVTGDVSGFFDVVVMVVAVVTVVVDGFGEFRFKACVSSAGFRESLKPGSGVTGARIALECETVVTGSGAIFGASSSGFLAWSTGVASGGGAE